MVSPPQGFTLDHVYSFGSTASRVLVTHPPKRVQSQHQYYILQKYNKLIEYLKYAESLHIFTYVRKIVYIPDYVEHITMKLHT